MLRRSVVNSVTIILLVTFLALYFILDVKWWGLVFLVLFAWFWITLLGSFLIRWNYHFVSLHSNKTIPEPYVSITFDDGPNDRFTPRILDLLQKHNAKATFFCIGQQIAKHPEILKRIIAEGHAIGNHTYTHSKAFGFFGLARVKSELQKTNALIKDLTGLQMNLYRPAFAVTNPKIEKAVKALNLFSIGWNVRSLDTTPRSEKRVLKRITSKISKGDIVLLHDTSDKTIAVLEQLLLFLEEKKLRSVSVDQLLNIKAYA
ncbi:polysaccharide deacetylase family protein [Aggregatimonas sangjinii]|uniref:Polysaccharide deacetylase family protein n=1 Tax=Aggregatimonas sangjinii TaxID=2583587 RepID=A0A5B7STF2_9FLAO|nr:polysaccharide deacetylase family protein [Aggregatimonas sangjinii]QCX01482.1 polysaccharide deacetylase family protein [Aggregatimonas sangjinii]